MNNFFNLFSSFGSKSTSKSRSYVNERQVGVKQVKVSRSLCCL